METRAVHRKTQTWLPAKEKRASLTCKSYFSFYSEVHLILYHFKYVTVSPTVLEKVTFPSEQPFRIIFILLVSACGQADLLPRAAAELPTPLILTGPQPLMPLSSQNQKQEGGLDHQPWEKPTSKCTRQMEPHHCQEGSATNHTPLPLTCNRLQSIEKGKTPPAYHVRQDISYWRPRLK